MYIEIKYNHEIIAVLHLQWNWAQLPSDGGKRTLFLSLKHPSSEQKHLEHQHSFTWESAYKTLVVLGTYSFGQIHITLR